MCGIAGIVKLDPVETVDEARLKRMRDVLRRGLGTSTARSSCRPPRSCRRYPPRLAWREDEPIAFISSVPLCFRGRNRSCA